MSVDEKTLGGVLEAIVAAGGATDNVPEVAGVSRDKGLDAVAELIERGWVTAGASNRGDGRLASVRNIRVTRLSAEGLRESANKAEER